MGDGAVQVQHVSLQNAGYAIRSLLLSADTCQMAREKGLTVSASVQEAIARAEIATSSYLPACRHVEALYFGDQGIL